MFQWNQSAGWPMGLCPRMAAYLSAQHIAVAISPKFFNGKNSIEEEIQSINFFIFIPSGVVNRSKIPRAPKFILCIYTQNKFGGARYFTSIYYTTRNENEKIDGLDLFFDGIFSIKKFGGNSNCYVLCRQVGSHTWAKAHRPSSTLVSLEHFILWGQIQDLCSPME